MSCSPIYFLLEPPMTLGIIPPKKDYVLPGVFLSVCLATSRKSCRSDLHENFTTGEASNSTPRNALAGYEVSYAAGGRMGKREGREKRKQGKRRKRLRKTPPQNKFLVITAM